MRSIPLAVTCVMTLGLAAIDAQAQWSTNGVKIFYNAGNVGIGTNNPAHKLDVRSGGAGRVISALASGSSGTNYAIYAKTNSNSGYGIYSEGGRNYMQGRLGLGVASPSQKLHVNGNIRVTGWVGNTGAGPVALRSANKQVGLFQFLTIDNVVTFTGANVVLGSEMNSVADGTLGATISGGGGTVNGINQGNLVEAWYGSIGGGYNNLVSADSGTVAGGNLNTATGVAATVGGGSGNDATGEYATIPGGLGNTASGNNSFAAGRRAQAAHVGSFVWGDSTNADIISSAADQFTARASGGVRFFTNSAASAGVEVAAGGGSWSSISDRNAKENFEKVNSRELLEKLAAIPMTTWNYKSQDKSIRHIGPMAQDFHAAFGVGESDVRITTIDADGVALAAIQGLHQMLKEKDAELEQMKQRLSKLEALLLERGSQ